MTTYVLGTHVSHDGSACLLKDGRILVAIEKERLTRIKHDGGNDDAAVQYCLNAAGITLKDVDLVVQNANLDMFERKSAAGRVSRAVDTARRVVTISHHLAHAYSALGTAPFRHMAVLIIDGCGNCYADCVDTAGAQVPESPANPDLAQLYFEKDSYYEYQDGRMRTVFKDFSPWGRRQRYPMYPLTTMHSIGGAYLGVSSYVFRGVEDPGKLMGLAPYGRPGVYEEPMFDLRDGRVFLNYDWMRNFDRPARDYSEFKRNFQYYADIAWWAQREIERALLYVVQHRYEMCPAENLAYAGGVALNAVANRLIRTHSRFKDLYMQPAAGDNGLAIGCAFYGWLEVLGQPRLAHDRSSHFGRPYSRDEIRATLFKCRSELEYEEKTDIVGACADLLAAGKIVAWFQAGSEFGPRALGNRSILAMPGNPEVRDFINAEIKFREDFRPFAPSVTAEAAATYFEQDYDSPYMILVAPAREQWRDRMPAVVHRDGSSRVQTVHREITPRYHALLEAVAQRTGMPILLNTSLNKRGTPIVETPREAIDLLCETALDALVLNDWLVVKKSTRPAHQRPLDLDTLLERVAAAVPHADPGRLPKEPFNLIVTGLQESWRVDISGRQPFTKSGGTSEQAIVMTAGAVQHVMWDPGSIKRLHESGEATAPGATAQYAQQVFEQLTYLLSLGRE